VPQHALARASSIAAPAGTKPTMVVAGLTVMALCAAAFAVPDIGRLPRRVTPAAQESIAS
jgi:hypothetical protein